MAIINVVKYEQQEGELVHMFPSHELRWGTQLVVYPGQVAFFLKGGQLCDTFTEGTYTLSTKNIPILYKLLALPFGFDSPFQADVWFVNLLSKLDLLWGTETPIQLEDPKYNIIIPVRAYGQYGIRISDPHKFVSKLVGNKIQFSDTQLQSYFRGIMLSKLTGIISRKIVNDGISILDINTQLEQISNYCQNELLPAFQEYGVDIINFNIISINVPEHDESLEVIKRAKSFTSRLNITGTDNYKMERTFDVLDSAASNQGGGGNLLNAGVGLAAGATLGNQMVGNIAQSSQQMPPPLPSAVQYYIGINGQQQGPYTFEEVYNAIANNTSLLSALGWKAGMSAWQPLSSFTEFANISLTPPPLS